VGNELETDASGIGALAEPARRELYLFVAGQPEAVSREQAARGVGVPVHTAKFHLDRLVEEGLLDIEFRRLSGRTGPGAGRPSKLYRRSSREVSVSLPERRYDLAGEILASAVDRAAGGGIAVDAAVREAAGLEGRRLAAGSVDTEGSELERTTEVLARHGYEPRCADDEITLANCPFDALAREHTDLVCGLNIALIDGVLEGLGCTHMEACLDPEPGMCCVKARLRP
jgi:predicted ArsR family transcriptional regulator